MTQAIQTYEAALAPIMPSVLETLTSNMDRTRFAQCMYLALSANPQALMPCVKNGSFQRAMTKAAAVGIYPDSVHAAIVPYGSEATFIPMYRGLIAKAVEGGVVADVTARVVYDGDKFRYAWGLANVLEHEPASGTKQGRPITHAYAIARFKDGRAPMFEVMSQDEIMAIKARARAQKGPWQTDYAEMARKTVTKRLCKYLPGLPIELQQAITDDDLDIATAEVIDEGKPKRPSNVAELVASLEAPGEPQDEPEAVRTMTMAEAQKLQATASQEAQGQGDEDAPWATGEELRPEDLPEFESRLPFGLRPGPWADWHHLTPWKGLLAGVSPAQAILGSLGGKRHKGLQNVLDFAGLHFDPVKDPNGFPMQAIYADYCLAFMLEKWAKEQRP